MLLSRKTIIQLNETQANIVGHMNYAASKLWNVCNYERQHYKELDLAKYPDWYYQKAQHKENMWYKALPSQTAQEVCKVMDQAWRSFYRLQKTGGIENPRPPRYKQQGIVITYMQNGIVHEAESETVRLTLSKQLKEYMKEAYDVHDNYLYLKNSIFKSMNSIKQLHIYPPEEDGSSQVIVVYEVPDVKMQEDNGRYLSIDLGLHNLLTCYDNEGRSFILGRRYLSICRKYDKEMARLQSQWGKCQSAQGIKYPKPSKHQRKVQRKKNNSIRDYLHKMTRYVVEYCKEQEIDVVIFDEASQIPVWDAIGAIGRGHNAIIVGDPRQMPPTSFFSRSKDAEDEDDGATEKDMESILDECLACNIPALNLNWHYRSKSESLIAYSNNQYYEQKLTTFPAPRTQDNAVHYHHVKGIYEPGSSKRINLAEATALVAHVVETLRNPDFRYTEASSIGIVTFNTQQQALIEDLLEAERAKDESLEPYFAENNPEAVFVKNLENVQGDERGVIYFSTTFGRDAKGKMSMNFGPLNLMGGERRLNVAITRARTAMHVFTSMMPEDIDLSRTRARGAADLRGFLDYARRGAAAYLELQQGIRLPEKDSLIARLTADLGARGWKCHTNVGVSDYRIDIAVEHPEAPDTVLAGIATDGYSYAAANTARDRDVLRHSVLHILGWRLLRVWAIDWWRNPAACVDALDAALKGFVEAGPLPAPELPLLTAPLAAAAETKAAIIEVAATAPEQLKPLEGEPYREARLHTTLPPLFEMSDSSLRPCITRFVEEEGPIKESFLMNRLRSHSLTPALSPTLRARLQEIITWQLERGEYCCRMEGATRVLYATGTPDVLPRAKGPRNWDDVPDSELRAISVQVLAHLKCISGCDDHLKGIATYLGIGRLTKSLREHLSAIVLTAGQDIVTK